MVPPTLPTIIPTIQSTYLTTPHPEFFGVGTARARHSPTKPLFASGVNASSSPSAQGLPTCFDNCRELTCYTSRHVASGKAPTMPSPTRPSNQPTCQATYLPQVKGKSYSNAIPSTGRSAVSSYHRPACATSGQNRLSRRIAAFVVPRSAFAPLLALDNANLAV